MWVKCSDCHPQQCLLPVFLSQSFVFLSVLPSRLSNAILTAVLNVFHTWPVALNKQHRLRTWRWENAGILDSQSCRGANNSIMRSFTISTLHRTRASLNEWMRDRYVTCLGRSPVETKVRSDNLKGRKLLWRRIRRNVNIKTNLKESARGCEQDSSGLGYSPVAGCCEHGYEPSDYMKVREFVDQLSYRFWRTVQWR
jgi:hypothetical protein